MLDSTFGTRNMAGLPIVKRGTAANHAQPGIMLTLEKIVSGAKVRGLAGPAVVEVVRVEWIGSDAINVLYRGADRPAEIVLFREHEPLLGLVV